MTVAAPPQLSAPTRVDLLAAARRRFLAGERLDMRALATELGVSRTTLYRWAGNHDQLLGEVCSRLTWETFQVAERDVRHHGRARVLAVYGNVLRLVAASDPLRTALRRDPQQFLRVVAHPGPVHRTLTTLCDELVRREVERGTLRPTTDIESLATAMVHLGGALYTDLLAGTEPNTTHSVEVLSLLLPTTP